MGDGFLVEAMKVKSTSCSMGNFAVKLVQRFFTQDQLVNIAGGHGERKGLMQSN